MLLWLMLPIGAGNAYRLVALAQQQPGQLDLRDLNQVAQAITVQVFAGDNRGSGILIHRQLGSQSQQASHQYWVLTNQHVVLPGAPYRIVTPDGLVHSVSLAEQSWPDADLALLRFEATPEYAVARLGSSATLTVDAPVFASGFPYNSESLVITSGEITLLPAQAIKNGYQLGYTNVIQLGMSGGPLLNQQGEVVGINGMSSFPILNSAYVFTDGSRPNQTQLEAMRRASWAIPIQTLERLQSPDVTPDPVPANIQFDRSQ